MPAPRTRTRHQRGYAAFRRLLDQRQELLDILHPPGTAD
jgi:hypothetical protein